MREKREHDEKKRTTGYKNLWRRRVRKKSWRKKRKGRKGK